MTIDINGTVLELETDPALFSPKSLDAGTNIMLSFASFSPSDKVLDLGCGYGAVGIYAAKQIGADRVTLSDIDSKAIALARKNAIRNGVEGVRIFLSDGFQDIDDAGYTLILSNPPYHTDFSVAKHFIEHGFRRLARGGHLIMVTKRRTWYKNKFIAVFGGVRIHDLDGYSVFIAEKRSSQFASRKKKQK